MNNYEVDPVVAKKASKFIKSLEGLEKEEIVCIISAVISTICVCNEPILNADDMAIAIYKKISGQDLMED